MKLLLFTLVTLLQNVYSQDYCLPPWEKVNEDICLLLKSEIKSWSHSRLLCNYYSSDLLYIDNADEQKTISDFFISLMRYRFNLKPYLWLGAIRKEAGSEWKWSHDNETLEYNNWSKPMSKRRNFDCACIRVKSGEWKNCDCASTEHFVCRKRNPNLIDKPSDETNSQINADSSEEKTTTEKPDDDNDDDDHDNEDDDHEDDENRKDKIKEDRAARKSKKNSSPKSEHGLAADEKNDDGKAAAEEMEENEDGQVATPLDRQFQTAKLSTNFIRDSSLFVNIYRTKIPKNSMQFLIFECPYGFGYYSTDSDDCTRYKICENWDNRYAIIALNQCVEGKIFSFKRFMCVDATKNSCDTRHFVPVV